MEHPTSMKGLAAIAALKSKIFIPPQELPLTLYEDLRNLNFLVKLKKEEVEIERKMKNVEERLTHANYEHSLFRNMLIDSPTDDEVWNVYLWNSMEKYSRIASKCRKEKTKISKEKRRRDDEEEMTLQKLQDFDKINVLVDMMM